MSQEDVMKPLTINDRHVGALFNIDTSKSKTIVHLQLEANIQTGFVELFTIRYIGNFNDEIVFSNRYLVERFYIERDSFQPYLVNSQVYVGYTDKDFNKILEDFKSREFTKRC